jgi:hypothetical protein
MRGCFGNAFMIRVHLAACFVAVLAVISGSAWAATSFFAQTSMPNDTNAYTDSMESWRNRFANEPVAEAYAAFVEEASSMNYDDAHFVSHVIGEIVFERMGEDGLSVCTADFGFGCYHGLSGAALSAQGLSALSALADACERGRSVGFRPGCMHGLGHGILAYLGSEKIEKALRACEPLQKGDTVGGCFGGVFMEYNLNTMQSATGVSMRPLIEDEKFEQCESVALSGAEAACYYEIPQWWDASFQERGLDTGTAYQKMGEWCESVSDPAQREICFQGIGNMVGPRSGYDPSGMEALCSEMPESYFTTCYFEALNHLLQSESGRSELKNMCSASEKLEASVCKSTLL